MDGRCYWVGKNAGDDVCKLGGKLWGALAGGMRLVLWVVLVALFGLGFRLIMLAKVEGAKARKDPW